MEKFSDLPLNNNLLKALDTLGYQQPTPVQQEAIPHILSGSDVLGSAQTGTGKTGAFLIPAVHHLLLDKNAKMLILAPTRELAKQVFNFAIHLLKNISHSKIGCALLIGGESISKQIDQLKRFTRIFIGTPGRIIDHIDRKTINLSNISLVVLDETDRMLDLGFGEQIEFIFQQITIKHQTLLFSATLPDNIMTLVNQYLDNPVRVAIGNVNAIADNIKQNIINTDDKNSELTKILTNYIDKTVIIFVRTQRATDLLSLKLSQQGYQTKGLHGGLKQAKRSYIIQGFKMRKFNVLVATDVAARGLDISHIECVVNFDVPDNPEDYVHRIGRTARANKSGEAYTLINKADTLKWNNVRYFLDPELKKTERSNKRDAKPGYKKTNKNNFWRNKTSHTGNNHKSRSFTPRAY